MTPEEFWQTWKPSNRKDFTFELAEDYAGAENAALAQQVAELTRNIETGFMNGAYARLQELQAAERRVAELKAERALMRDATNKELVSLRESWNEAERKIAELREAIGRELVREIPCYHCRKRFIPERKELEADTERALAPGAEPSEEKK
jgi:hypothetical protein